MASSNEFLEFILEQLDPDLEPTYKKMFGEYGIYSHGKIVALVCDDSLFIKPTKAGGEFIKNPTLAPPYPTAKPYFLIDEGLEDPVFLSELIRITEKELLPPKPKKKVQKGEKQN